MEHADLVAEMTEVEQLSTQDRLHLARLRRAHQLKVAKQKEKEWMKAQNRRERNGTSHQGKSKRRNITFKNNVVLLDAASRNDFDEVHYLLEQGVSPDATNEDGLTPLHQCCIDNNAEMLKLLLDYGAYVNAEDREKWTPLHAAATCGHLNLVRILINRGANLLAVNMDGNMPYDLCNDMDTLDHIEAEMSKRGITQELIDDTRAATETQMLHDLQMMADNGMDLEQPNREGATPLHIAAANGYVHVVEFLLDNHVSVDPVDNDLWTPVHAAACWRQLDILELLVQCGADLNAKTRNDETPFDICEDEDIKERIEQLKTEQESKKLAEAQRRRVRRSQSSNTRAQSVRRTSLRDKTLTTKKDAVEEARLRLQAQEDLLPTQPTGTTSVPSHTINGNVEQTTSTHHGSDLVNGKLGNNKPDKKNLGTTTTDNRDPNSNSINNNTTSGGVGGGGGTTTTGTTTSIVSSNGTGNRHTKSINSNGYSNNNHLSNNATTIPNGGNNMNNNNGNLYNGTTTTASSVSSITAHSMHNTTNSTTLMQRRSPEGKDNDDPPVMLEERTMAQVATTAVTTKNTIVSTSNKNVKPTGDISAEIFSASNENGKINVQVTVLVDHSIGGASATASAANSTTLANLKKQRALNRSSSALENGTILGPASLEMDTHSNGLQSNDFKVFKDPMKPETTNSKVTKFSGVTSDIVSDSTDSSRRCCSIM